jgi:hypothetical protein
MRRLLAGLLLALVALALPLPAYADAFSGYDTQVTGIDPAIKGVTATAPQNGESLTVENPTSTPLILLGYGGEPAYKVSTAGAFYNKASPSYKLNQQATIGTLGGDRNFKAAPVWVKLNGSDIVQWHDHRIHWMGSEEPPGVQRDPHTAQLISRWKVPFTYGGRKGHITGTLSWKPGSRWGHYLIWIVVALAVVALVIVQFVIRPRRRPAADPTDPHAED